MDNQHPRLESLQQSGRWFGPTDPVTLDDARQTGAKVIVTSLHEIPTGAVWTREAIKKRLASITEVAYRSQRTLQWSVV